MSFAIAAGQTTSNSLETTDACPGLALQLPATAVGTSFAVHGLISGSTYAQIYNDGVALSVPFSANSVHVISPTKLLGVRSFKLVSNAMETSGAVIAAKFAKVM